MKTLNEIVKAPGVYDLGGETIQGGRLEDIDGVTIKNGTILATPGGTHGADCLTANDCNGLWVESLRLIAPPDLKMQGLLNILGGNDVTGIDIVMEGGRCAGQLHVGMGSAVGKAGVPVRWNFDRLHCTGNQLWNQYPQAHCTYLNTLPTVDSDAHITNSYFEQASGEGHVLKIGSTANNPWFEGTSGVHFDNCHVVCAPGPDDRAIPLLVQGAGSKNNTFSNMVCEMVHSPYSLAKNLVLQPKHMDVITLVQGASAVLTNIKFPTGAEQSVERVKSFLGFRYFATEKRVAAKNVGGQLIWLSQA